MQSKKNYIISCVKCLLNLQEEPKGLYKSTIIDKFLSQADQQTLILSYSSMGGFKNYVLGDRVPQGSQLIHVTKTGQSQELENPSRTLSISLRPRDPMQYLLKTIKGLYSPIVKNSDPTALSSLDNLRLGLQFQSKKKIKDQNDLDIGRLTDEFQFWEEMSGHGTSARVVHVHQCYAKIDKKWRTLREMDIIDMRDLIQNMWMALQKIWNSQHAYSEKRLAKVVDLMVSQITNRLSDEFGSGTLWKNDLESKVKLLEAVDVCRQFQKTGRLHQLQLFKKKVNAFNFKPLQELESKFLTAMRIRSEVQELNRVHKIAAFDFDPNDLLQLLASFNFLTLSIAQTKQFQQALDTLKSKIKSVLGQCATIIGKDLMQASQKNNSQAVFNCLKKWENLLRQDESKSRLIKQLDQVTKIIANQFLSQQQELQESKKEKPIDRLSKCKPTLAKLRKLSQLSAELLDICPSYDQLIKAQQLCQSKIEDTEKDSLKIIRSSYQTVLKDPNSEGCQKIQGKRTTLNFENGNFDVVIPSQTRQFVVDMKQLHQLGYVKDLPQALWDTFDIAKRFHREHLILKQLSNSFNSIRNTMIPSQQPMLNKQMEQFQDILRNPKGKKKRAETGKAVTWDTLQQIQAFIDTLSRWLSSLQDSVKRLRNAHSSIEQSVISMLGYPLVPSNFGLYSQKLESIEKTVELAAQGRDSLEWRRYWDYQISKVVENTWRQAMIQGIKVTMVIQLVMNGRSIGFRPEIYQIREQYYNQLKAFVSWPVRIRGVGGAPELYKCIVDNNSEYMLNLYQKTELTFAKVQALVNDFGIWEMVASLDIDSLEDKLTSDQLSCTLISLRDKKDQVQKISDEMKIDSITVNLELFKQSLRNMLDQHIQSLIQIIKGQIKKQSQEVEAFIVNALEKISKKPKNMEEMADVLKEYEKVKKMQEEMQKKVKEIQQKNTNIRSLTGASFNTTNMLMRWQNFQMASNDFDRVLGDQKNSIRQEVQRRGQTAQAESQKMMSKWQQIKPKVDKLDRDTANGIYQRMKEWQVMWNELETKVQTCVSDSEHFNMKPPDLSQFYRNKKQLDDELGNWKIFAQYSREIEEISKQPWLTFRGQLHKFSDISNKYSSLLSQAKREDMVYKYMAGLFNSNKNLVQLLKSVNGENFQREHWGELIAMLKIDKSVNSADKLTFGHLIESDMIGKAQEIRQLEARAKGEVAIRDALSQLQVWSDTRQFELSEYSSMGRITPLIKEWKDLMTEVSDHQSLVASLRDSKFSGRFKEQIEQYDVKFASLDQFLLRMNQIQRKWVYLQPIFMRGALPEQQGRWRRLDQDYRNIMLNISSDNRVVQLCSIPGFKETLDTILQQLERCQKALNDFLQEKRNKFPRFYFIGDDDLLEILGQSQNPTVIQQHLKKLFSGIHTVTLLQLPPTVVEMNSSLGQRVKLMRVIEIDDTVEKWLEQLNVGMVETLKNQLKKITKDKENPFAKYPSQIICLDNQINFNIKVNEAIESSSLARLQSNYQSILAELTAKCHGSDQLTLSKLKSLILDVIHQIDVIGQLSRAKIKEKGQWAWYKQLRFMKKGEDIGITMANASFIYTFEYQGNAAKLVHTPLTDKCYLTLTQAMHMGFGGNPYGPAGTGKTQSVKALGQAFARQVLVFNCDEGLDFHSMGRIFTGLVKCGAWGCFDQFNRLLEQQLSAISQQIQVIQEAIKLREKTMNLLGKTIEVNPNSGIFVTLNPAGKGYGGRSKLPDNLKQLFRPVAMSVPDNELIAQVLLYSQGFKTAKLLAQKIITVFTLSKQLLSKQQHYDWGLRALKTILTVAGRLIFQEKGVKTDQVEAQLLIKALRINTLSKLTFSDMNKFVILIKDVFPGISVKDIIYEKIAEAVKKVFEEDKRNLLENQINKILQFYEATKQRIGAVLVGPSGCGKTTIWKTLKRAYEKLGQQVKVHLINPKAMPRSQLLGNMNNDTRQFSEGILTQSAREVIKTEQNVLNWIICDGDIDPEWIESLNSVLDDNHLLTLPTGQRISFGTNVNFIFQTDNLQFASPATVSRMGMIFLNNEDINIEGIISRWVSQYGNEILAKNINNIMQAVNNLYEMNDLKEVVGTTKVGLVRSVLSQLSSVTTDAEFKAQMLKGLASNYDHEGRMALYRLIYGKDTPDDPLGFQVKGDTKTTYEADQNSVTINNRRVFYTKQLKRDLKIVQPWMKRGEHIIVVGKEGCGKSILVDAAIAELEKSEKCKVVTIHCNRQTTGATIIQKLTQVCQKSSSATGRVLKPMACSKQIVILKEINLPKPDKYNTIQLISFLQAIITHNGFYDSSLEFVKLGQGIQFISIMKPDSTLGRYEITSRFVSNVRVLWVDYNSVGTKESLAQLTPQSKNIDKRVESIWSAIQTNFPADERRHYLFSPRDLNSLVDNLALYDINFNKEDEILLALQYELNRQFGDRLVSLEEKQKFKAVIKPILGQMPDLYFIIGENRKLVQSNKSQYTLSLKNTVEFYQREVKDMKIVIVPEVLELIAAIEKRILEGGSLFLAGSSGNFRRNAVNLMAFKHKYQLVSPLVLKNSTIRDFYKDMKGFLEIAGGQNKKVMLFFEDHHLQKSQFIQKVNSLISSGQIPGLFAVEQIEHIVQDAQQMRSEFPGRTIYEGFIERLKKNLIVVVSMDHRNKNFSQICSSNPAFFSKCRVVWLDCMSPQSMQAYAVQTLSGMPKLQGLVDAMIQMHQGSSRTFCSLLDTFKLVYSKSLSKQGNKTDRLNQGLAKLKEAQDTVDTLTREAEQKQTLLAVKQKQADASLVKITNAMQTASENKVEAEKLKDFLSSEQSKIQSSKAIVQDQLSDVQPLIEKAKKAVGGITRGNLDELKSFMNPPEPVRHVLKAVLYMFGNQDESWNSMKTFIKTCVEKIMNFDIDKVKPDLRREVESQMAQYARSFERDVIYKASAAAGPLADWVKAVVQYSKVYEKVSPLQKQLNGLEAKLQSSRSRLKVCTKQLEDLQITVKELQEDFSRKINEAQSLKADLAKAQETVSTAKNLLNKLKDEKLRWESEKEAIRQELHLVPKYSVLSAGYITYMSEFPENVRQKFCAEWKKNFNTPDYNFLKFVSNQSALLKETALGLPNDTLSLENSQMVYNSSKVVLMMDPNSQASAWLKNNLGSKGPIQVLNHQDPKFMNLLELAIRFGKTLIIQELDSIQPMLIPILKKDLHRYGSRLMFQVGDKQIDFNQSFRLFLVTRNSNIELSSSQKDLISFVNFSVTRSGLEDKLLSIIITHEQPELESKKQAYLEREEQLKVSLSEMEEKLLKELAESTGNILENKTLIESLNQTKQKSTVIAESLLESQQLQKKLDQERNAYRPLAECGATIFITLGQLKKLNPMYKFSLLQFIDLFKQSLKVENVKGDKLEFIKVKLISIVYNHIAIGLVKVHRLVFAVTLVKELFPEEIPDSMYDILLGNVAVDGKIGLPRWLDPTEKEKFQALQSGQHKVDFSDSKWEDWYRMPSCEDSVPGKGLSQFNKSLIVQACRPQRLLASLSNMSKVLLKLDNLAGLSLNFKNLTDSIINSELPALFVVSAGFDPSKQLQEHADQTIGRENYKQLSMGGNQNELALEMLRDAARKGQWLCLKNLHLVVSFLSTLEKQFKALPERHKNFRLFLTTEMHIKFPSILLQSCFKVSYEAPPGLKQNLNRITSTQQIDSSNKGKLLFTLCFFHALIQERRNYIPQGWTKSYEFNYGDFRAGNQLVQEVAGNSINWEMLRGLMLDTVYGGRIDNDVDLNTLRVLLNEYFCQETLNAKNTVFNGQTIKDQTDILKRLPDLDNPLIYGLPLSIEKTVQRFNTNQFINNLKVISSADVEQLKFSRDIWSKMLKIHFNLWKNSEKSILDSGVKEGKASKLNLTDPIDSFVMMEASQAYQTYKIIKHSINKLEAVANGTEILTSQIQDEGTKLLTNNVPSKWCKDWEGPDLPLTWLKEFTKKIISIKKWTEAVESGNLLKQEVDLNDLFHPEILLNALRQKTARQQSIPINQLQIAASFDPPKNSGLFVKLKNVVLQGCNFQNGTLTQADIQLPEFVTLPTLFIHFTNQPINQSYEPFPLYSGVERQRLLAKIHLQIDGEAKQKIIAGVALFLKQ